MNINQLNKGSFWISLVVIALTATASPVSAEEITPEMNRFFEMKVRPLLLEKCADCHGKADQKGGLRVDSRSALIDGGDSGPAISPDDLSASLFLEAIRYESYEMPPDGKLAAPEIEILEKWVEMGAFWPGTEEAPATPRPEAGDRFTPEEREFWSLQPPREQSPTAVTASDRSHGKIDQFIAQHHLEQGLSFAEQADRRTLIRRLSLGLTGLPPTSEQTEEFLNDADPNAYEKLVDQYLASPRYGEHWSRFWLDLVRYAESDGYRKDDYRPQAWRYRDYVINAFNNDKPYRDFIAEQIAGDEIAPHDPEVLAATGFLRHSTYEYNQRDARLQWQDTLNDITDTVGDAFLGVGMGCARCHDHKFDPILQKDYFRLQAFFANVSFRDDIPMVSPEEVTEYERQLAHWQEQTRDLREQIARIEEPHRKFLTEDCVSRFPEDVQGMYYTPEQQRNSLEKQISRLVDLQIQETIDRVLKTRIKGDEKTEWEEALKQLAEFDSLKPAPLPYGQTVGEQPSPPPKVFITGRPRLGEVTPGFLTILETSPVSLVSPEPDQEAQLRRSDLAAWLTKEDHPLVSRVIVNRIWKEHFGAGIVGTPSDFGHLGEKPTHPALLDWLAVQFVKNGWSMKWLHKQIVMSAAYKQTSLRNDSALQEIDPDNRYLWKFPVRRMSGEQVHDSILFVTGELDLTVGGPGDDHRTSQRRSVYNRMLRNDIDPLLQVFDFPDRMASVAERNTTTTSAQALLLMNGDWMQKRAQALTQRVQSGTNHDLTAQINSAYQTALGRPPREEELAKIQKYVDHQSSSEEAMIDLCHLLLNSNEFVYVD